jgi:microbial collagenase
MAKTGTYRLSDIFGNTYGMADYVNRAYRWGYMATRFMMEKHRADVDVVLGDFRVGDYDRYQNFMGLIGTRYDAEFSDWVASATTAGEPPMPNPALPACASTSYLGKNCGIGNLGVVRPGIRLSDAARRREKCAGVHQGRHGRR